MNLFIKNYTFYVLFFLIIIITSEAQKKTSMCNKYIEQACYGQLPSRRPKRSLGRINNDFTINHILGGITATPKQYPHMALVGTRYKNFAADWFCGGSLISENFVLTAAHCTMPPPPRSIPSQIRLGELDLASTAKDATPIDYKILKIIVHPDYRASYFQNDIALLRFQGVSTFTDYIRPLCLNVFEEIPNQKLIVQGLGKKEDGRASDKLLAVELDLQSNERCKSLFGGYNGETMACIGYLPGGKDACAGDSGGPVVILNNQTKCSSVPIYSQVGIVSSGLECGLPHIPAIYTRVSYFIPWIEKHVWKSARHFF